MSGKNWNGVRRTSLLPLNPAIAIHASGNRTLTAMRTTSTVEPVLRNTRTSTEVAPLAQPSTALSDLISRKITIEIVPRTTNSSSDAVSE